MSLNTDGLTRALVAYTLYQVTHEAELVTDPLRKEVVTAELDGNYMELVHSFLNTAWDYEECSKRLDVANNIMTDEMMDTLYRSGVSTHNAGKLEDYPAVTLTDAQYTLRILLTMVYGDAVLSSVILEEIDGVLSAPIVTIMDIMIWLNSHMEG